MLRSASLLVLLTIAQCAHGQGKPTLVELRQTAEKTSADWDALSKGLEQKIARLLPCDSNARAAVEEVSRASAARMSALSAYLQAEAAEARNYTEAAKRVLSAQATLGGEWAAERAESEQDHTAIEAQIAELKESMRQRAALNGAEQVLVELSRMAKERTARADEQANRKDAVNQLIADVLVSYQERQVSLEKESALVDLETARWSFYYATRVTRAVTECAIINPGAAKRRQ